MESFFDLLYSYLHKFSSKEKLIPLKLEANNSIENGYLQQERKLFIEKTLGIEIHNFKYFEEALIHRSYLHLLPKDEYKSNERLEFLGDAVLNLIVSEYLFQANPDSTEGDLTKMRSWLVNKHSLAVVARKLELDKLVLISFNTAKTFDRSGDSILSDAIEAMIAALYLDSGLEQTKKFIVEKLVPLLQEENVLQDKNYKSILMEKVQAEGKMAPKYDVIKEYGPPHDKIFYVAVFIQGNQVAIGQGKSKKEAEQDAAKNALKKLNFKNGE